VDGPSFAAENMNPGPARPDLGALCVVVRTGAAAAVASVDVSLRDAAVAPPHETETSTSAQQASVRRTFSTTSG
jgi:hypothetical protein